jgi:hypothetical protein
VLTNFIFYGSRNEGEGGTEFERYHIIDERLAQTDGVISEEEAMALLAEAQIQGRTHWSV